MLQTTHITTCWHKLNFIKLLANTNFMVRYLQIILMAVIC